MTTIMLNTAYNRPTHEYSVADSNTAIRKYFEKELGIPEGCKDRKTIKRALRRNKVRFFEIIEDTVEDLLVSGWRDNEFFERFVEFKNLELGDQNLFYVDDDSVLTVNEISEGNNDLIRQKLAAGSEYVVKTKKYGVAVYEEYIRFQVGAIEWAKYVEKIYEAFDKKVNDMIFSAFMGLENSVPEGFSQTGDPTLEKAVALAEAVETATGEPVVIAGTRSAVSKLMNLTPSGWVSDAMKTERNTTGAIASFEGYEVMVVPNSFEAGTTTPKYSNNKLYFIPKTDARPIKFVYEGDMDYSEDTEKTSRRDQTIEAEITFRGGIAVVFGKYYGVYTWS